MGAEEGAEGREVGFRAEKVKEGGGEGPKRKEVGPDP